MTAPRIVSFLLMATAALAAEKGLPDFVKVNDTVYRGRQPAAEGFASLAKLGIKTVIDLRGGPIHAPREKKQVEAVGLVYVSERFSGIFPPRDEQIARLVAIMQDPAATPVFIHCRRGADRAGLLIACYRMMHDGWTNERALAEAKETRLSRLEFLMSRYIRNFKPSRLKSPPAGVPAKSPLAMMFHFVLGNHLADHTF